jgi:hypothetical protein
MPPKGFPGNPGELPHFLLTMGGTDCQGKPEATGKDGRAVLRPRSTCEGGEPQGVEWSSGRGLPGVVFWRTVR